MESINKPCKHSEAIMNLKIVGGAIALRSDIIKSISPVNERWNLVRNLIQLDLEFVRIELIKASGEI